MPGRVSRSVGPAILSVVLTGLTAQSQLARAQPVPAREHEVTFKADHVEVDGDAEGLRLSGDVVVRAGRFQITSSDIGLSRSRRGLHVTGAGRLSFCPCPAPPVTLGFSSADFAPPTDILLYGTTLRVLGAPTFWSPILWLRAADRLGMLPPNLSYRGEEGFGLGTGLHVPLGPLSAAPSRLEWKASAYSRGALRTLLHVQTEHGYSNLVLDSFDGQTALEASSQWSHVLPSGAVLAERLELMRGVRSQVAPPDLDRVALPRDRLRVAVGHAGAHSFGFSLQGDAPRATAFDQIAWIGPGFSLGLGKALGRSAMVALELDTRSGRGQLGDLFWGSASWAMAVTVPLSSLSWETELRQRASWLSVVADRASAVRSILRSRLGLPLVRRGKTHTTWLEPYLEVASLGARLQEGQSEATLTVAPEHSSATASEFLATGLVGLKLAFGELASRNALEWQLSSGGLLRGFERRNPAPLVSTQLRAALPVLRATGQLAADPETRTLEATFRTELGVPDAPQLGLRVDSRNTQQSLISSLESDISLWGRMLASPGTSLRARVGTPLPLGFRANFGSDFDLNERRMLASAGELAYRHSCKCVSLFLAGSRRVGRRGFDVNVGLELFPR